MRATLTLSAVLSAVVSLAQHVFVHPDAVPTFGGYPVETRSYGVVSGLVTTGTGVVWDFSSQGFSVVGTTVDSVLAPSATPYSADFPAATHAVRLVNQFGFYQAGSDAVQDLGTRLSAGSPSQINTDPARIVQFPSSVADTWSDAVATSNTTSELHVTVLAEGTIILSDATIPDAVLVERRMITPSFTSTSTTWFRKSNCLVPLGNVLVTGGVIVRVPEELITGVNEAYAWDVSVAPNPLTDRTVLSRGDGQMIGQVRVLDAVGREVITVQVPGSSMTIDLSAHPVGTYFVHVVSADGTRVVKVQRTR